MIHMLSSFDLRDPAAQAQFCKDYATFVEDLRKAEVIEDAGPLGRRVSDTPMDTDDARTHQLFSIIRFRDRAHLDDAYAYIEKRLNPGTQSHSKILRGIKDGVFLCWEDLGDAL